MYGIRGVRDEKVLQTPPPHRLPHVRTYFRYKSCPMAGVEWRKSSDANIVDDVIGKGDGSEVYLQYCEVDKS